MESKSAMLLTAFQCSISHQLRKHRDHLPMTSTSQHEISTWTVLFPFQDAFICSAECNSAKHCMLDFPGAEPHPNSRQVCQLAHLRASAESLDPKPRDPGRRRLACYELYEVFRQVRMPCNRVLSTKALTQVAEPAQTLGGLAPSPYYLIGRLHG